MLVSVSDFCIRFDKKCELNIPYNGTFAVEFPSWKQPKLSNNKFSIIKNITFAIRNSVWA